MFRPETGSCACGAVQFSADARPKSVIHCHCGLCRRLSGAAFTTWVSYPREAFNLSGEATLCRFEASPNTTRHFCRICGTHIYSLDVRYPDIVGVPAGIISDALSRDPEGHYFVEYKASWYGIHDALPKLGSSSPSASMDERSS